MSDQEMKQNEVIESIFYKVDTDGSGSLDVGEILHLFKQNDINLERETIKEMFQGN